MPCSHTTATETLVPLSLLQAWFLLLVSYSELVPRRQKWFKSTLGPPHGFHPSASCNLHSPPSHTNDVPQQLQGTSRTGRFPWLFQVSVISYVLRGWMDKPFTQPLDLKDQQLFFIKPLPLDQTGKVRPAALRANDMNKLHHHHHKVTARLKISHLLSLLVFLFIACLFFILLRFKFILGRFLYLRCL